jgi:hypothetical protein
MTYGNNLNIAKTIVIFPIERLLLLATVNSCQLLFSKFEVHIGISMILIF